MITICGSESTIPACWRGERHGIELRDWFSLCGTMEDVVVFSTYEVEWDIGKTRFERDHLEVSTHRIVHVGFCTQHRQ